MKCPEKNLFIKKGRPPAVVSVQKKGWPQISPKSFGRMMEVSTMNYSVLYTIALLAFINLLKIN